MATLLSVCGSVSCSEIQAKAAEDEEKKAGVKAEAQMLATALTTIGKFSVKKTAGTGDDKDKLFGRYAFRKYTGLDICF